MWCFAKPILQLNWTGSPKCTLDINICTIWLRYSWIWWWMTFNGRVILLDVENGRRSGWTDGFQRCRRFVDDAFDFSNAGTANIGARSSFLHSVNRLLQHVSTTTAKLHSFTGCFQTENIPLLITLCRIFDIFIAICFFNKQWWRWYNIRNQSCSLVMNRAIFFLLFFDLITFQDLKKLNSDWFWSKKTHFFT